MAGTKETTHSALRPGLFHVEQFPAVGLGVQEAQPGNGEMHSALQQQRPPTFCEVFQQLAGLLESADTGQIVPRGTISLAWSGHQEGAVRNAKRILLSGSNHPSDSARYFSSLQGCGICAIVPRGTISNACSGDLTTTARLSASYFGRLQGLRGQSTPHGIVPRGTISHHLASSAGSWQPKNKKRL